ncbi:methyltransferase domain-containing protein [Spongiactinospora sp. TRM90649]|uniref:methyltransferase domain-containing protein n=1 Tax=Spongiactinospora sp. TRM90649 TaxID=3031114 RepID=UPI0023F76A91|nr:methyltransferase domain-containing protein [Spongiactinospora sp. TRM90649]MDF5759156.1 methyltransferase domain-containing protein [Spongiactinospora sp. TRM90649]
MAVPPVLLKEDELLQDEADGSAYETARDISKYLLMHYGTVEDAFERPHHPLAPSHGYPARLSELLELVALRTGTLVRTALDAGCSVGGISHALSTWVQDVVVGIDASPRSIEIAQSLTRHGGGTFSVVQLGPFSREIQVTLPEAERRARVEFDVDDACSLAVPSRPYDAVVLSNVLDRVRDPEVCLRQFTDSTALLRRGGLLMVACPWSWYPEFSPPETWLGSSGDCVTSEQGLKNVLSGGLDLMLEKDEAGVLRQNPREYDYFEAHVTVWKKR